MHIHLWARPVDLQTYIGDYRRIASTEEAVGFLVKNWPIDSRGQPVRGRQKFIVEIRNATSIEDARATFIEACMHLGVEIVESP
ncbi:DUF982 domain-containing protein [Labrys sp. La1]|uniref:DUF982 domain-containing protein n=1 Tax=Labrys sp. La1 TaxID=3404917 RepID=UPI003EC12481